MNDPKTVDVKAPERYQARLDTTKGPIVIAVERALAPLGADRFFSLVKAGYYDDVAFFRVVSGFVAQGGIHGDPAINKVWREARIKDDPVKSSNVPGTVTFATSGANARTTQFFINLKNNARLDGMGFAAFGRIDDLTAVNALHSGYGEGAPSGNGPQQGRIHKEGNAYLRAEFPELDYITRATIL